MRILEAAILAVLLTTMAGFFWRGGRRSRWMAFLPSVAVAMTVVHLLVERYRWQMVPTCALVVILFLSTLRSLRGAAPSLSPPTRLRTVLRIVTISLGLIVLAVIAALPLMFPVFNSPRPTGPHAVGTTAMSFVDHSRTEVFTPDPHDRRDLAIPSHSYPGAPVSASGTAYPVLIFCAQSSGKSRPRSRSGMRPPHASCRWR